VFGVDWKLKLEEKLKRIGFIMQIERLSMQNTLRIEATNPAFLFFPITLKLYERMGWKMVAIESTIEHHDDDLDEEQVKTMFDYLLGSVDEEMREDLLGYYFNTGCYLTEQDSRSERLIDAIESTWLDGHELHVDTFEEYPVLSVAPPWADQAYAFAREADGWAVLVGRTGRPASDYRADGTEIRSHRLPEGELFTKVEALTLPLDEWTTVKQILKRERREIERFRFEALSVARRYDPSFGFAWRETWTYYHGVPVDPYVQRLWLENGKRRFRIMQRADARILALGETHEEAIEELDAALAALPKPRNAVSPIGQFVLGIWQQIERDEATYIEGVECVGISIRQANERVQHALSRRDAVSWVERSENGEDICEFAGLEIRFPHRPPGRIHITRLKGTGR